MSLDTQSLMALKAILEGSISGVKPPDHLSEPALDIYDDLTDQGVWDFLHRLKSE